MSLKRSNCSQTKRRWHVVMGITINSGTGTVAVLQVMAVDPKDAGRTAMNLWAAANPPGDGNITVMKKPRRARADDVPLVPEGFVDPIALQSLSQSTNIETEPCPADPPQAPQL